MGQQKEVNTNQRSKMTEKEKQTVNAGKKHTENVIENKVVENKKEVGSPEKKVEETNKKTKAINKPKKNEAIVRASNIPMSLKHSKAICKFIKWKTIAKARQDLEEVVKIKKPVPMKGEIPHRKGKIMSGRFPQKAARNFIVLLKSLAGNSQDLSTPIITEAIANFGERPYGKSGRVRKQRTHVLIKATEKSKLKELNKKKKPKKKTSRGEK